MTQNEPGRAEPSDAAAAPAADATTPAADATNEPTHTDADAADERKRTVAARRRRILIGAAIWAGPPLAAMFLVHMVHGIKPVQMKYELSIIALVVPVAIAWLLSRRDQRASQLAASLSATFPALLVLVVLKGTRWYFSGVAGDQGFRIEYLTRFTHSIALHDYSYAKQPAFYAPGWFWLAGRGAALTNTPGWAAYKPAAVLSIWLAGVLAFFAWRLTVSAGRAAVFTAVTCFALPFAAAAWLSTETFLTAALYEPYAWVVLAPLPAIVAWAAAAVGRHDVKRSALLGLALGGIAWCFSQYGMIAVIAVGVAALMSNERVERLKDFGIALGVAVLVTLPWTLPFAVSWLANGHPNALAATYFNDASWGSLSLTATAAPFEVVAFVGVVALLAGFPRAAATTGLRAVGVVIVAAALAQAWLGRGGHGVLFHRLMPAVALVTALAGANVACEVWSLARPAIARYVERPQGIVFGVLAVLLVVAGSGHAVEIHYSPMTHAAVNEFYPDGHTPRGADAPGLGISIDAFVQAITDATGEKNPEKLSMLTTSQSILAQQPYDAYEQWWELYANPLGKYGERRAKIEALSHITDPKQMLQAIKANGGPDVFVLPIKNGVYEYSSQTFDPKTAGVGGWTASFDPKAFDDPCFVHRTVAGWEIVAVRC